MVAKKVLLKILVAVFLLFIFVISVGPILWVFTSSFKGNADILNGELGFPGGVLIKNYETAFEIAPIISFYGNSLFVAFFAIIINVFTMSMAAYVISRVKFRASKFFRLLFSSSLLIPGAALLIPIYTTINNVGLLNNLWALILVYAGFGLPTTLFIMSSYFLTIPKELEESAYLDGCSFFRTFATIILPLARPAFATAIVLQFLLCWNEFQFAITLTTGTESRTIPIALFYFKSSFASDYGAMFAATMLVIIPSIIVYVVMQKQVVSGLAAGSVKG